METVIEELTGRAGKTETSRRYAKGYNLKDLYQTVSSGDTMRKLLWKLFAPYEVKLTIDEAKAFLTANEWLCRGVIEPDVMSLIKDAEKTVYSIRIERMKPDQLALLLITNVIGAHLGSGQHHVYRGALSMIGQDMLKVWNEAQNEMLEKGYSSKEEVTEDNKWIAEQIRSVG